MSLNQGVKLARAIPICFWYEGFPQWDLGL